MPRRWSRNRPAFHKNLPSPLFLCSQGSKCKWLPHRKYLAPGWLYGVVLKGKRIKPRCWLCLRHLIRKFGREAVVYSSLRDEANDQAREAMHRWWRD